MMAATLEAKATQLRQSLAWSKELTQDGCAVLDAYCAQINALDSLLAPIAARTLALSHARDNIKKARARAEEVLDHLDTSRKVEARILHGPQADLPAFMHALDRLEAAITFLMQHRSLNTAEAALRHATDLRKDAMQLCLEDFMQGVKESSTLPPNLLLRVPTVERGLVTMVPEGKAALLQSEAGKQELELIPAAQVPRLRTLADAMLRSGDAACFKGFSDAQRQLVDQCLGTLATEKLSTDDCSKMAWPAMEAKIRGWITALRAVVRVSLAQRRLCSAVFSAPWSDNAFQEVVTRGIQALVQSGNAIAKGKRAPDKLYGLLDMHEHLATTLPSLVQLLSGSATKVLLQDLLQLTITLQQEVRETYAEFEQSIVIDTVKHTVADGTVHPLSAYALSFLKRLFSYESALRVIFAQSTPSTAALLQTMQKQKAQQTAAEALQDPALLAGMTASIRQLLDALMTNLNAKAKSYKDKALAALFLMNNVHYVIKAVEASPALVLVGEDWVEQHKDQIEEFGEQYQTLSWGPLIAIVKEDATSSAKAQVAGKSKTAMKERFSTINAQLQAFLEKHKAMSFTSKPEKYLVYTAELVQQMLMDFFEQQSEAEHSSPAARAAHRLPSQHSKFPHALPVARAASRLPGQEAVAQ